MKTNYRVSFGFAVLALTAFFALTLMGCGTTSAAAYRSVAKTKPADLQTMETQLAKAKKSDAQAFMKMLLGSGGGNGAWDESNTIPALRLLINKGADVNNNPTVSRNDFWDSWGGVNNYSKGETPLYIVLTHTYLSDAQKAYNSKQKNPPPTWSESLCYEIVKFLLENGADPSIKYEYHHSGSSYWADIRYPIQYAEPDALQALLVEHGSPDLATAQKETRSSSKIYESSSDNYSDSSGSSSSGSAPSAGGSAQATLRDGTYQMSGSTNSLQFNTTLKSVEMTVGGKAIARGSYQINGSTLSVTFTSYYGDAADRDFARKQFDGKTFVYTLAGDSSFSGNGETWTRTGF